MKGLLRDEEIVNTNNKFSTHFLYMQMMMMIQ